MAAAFNKVILLGNCTRDVEIKYLQSGVAVAEIGMAISEKRKGADGNMIEETTFVDVTVWGRTAEVAGQYLSKGAPVMIEGKLRLDQWEKDGKKLSKLKVVGETLQLLGRKSDSQGQQERQPERRQPEPPQQQGGQYSDDIPF